MLSALTSEKVTVVSEIWPQFNTKINEVIQNEDSERLSITLSTSDSSCIIAGEKSHVKKVFDELKEMVDVMTKEDKFMKAMVIDNVQLNEHWQKLILVGPELDKVQRKYPELRIAFTSPKSGTLCFEGRYDKIQEAKKHVLNFLQNSPRYVMTAKATTKTLLWKPEMRKSILRRMNGRRLVWDSSDLVHGVLIYTLVEADIEMGIKAIRDVIKEHTLNFRSATEQIIRKALTDLQRKFNGLLSYEINDDLLEFSVSWDADNEVMATINGIVQDPTKKKCLSLDSGMIRLLKAHMMEKLNKICQQFNSFECSYDFDGVSGITLTCLESQFENFHSAFMVVINGVCHSEEKFGTPGFWKLLSIQKGRDRIKALEHRHHVCIDIKAKSGGTAEASGEASAEASAEHFSVHSGDAMSEAAPFTVQTGNCKISVHYGSILQCKADALVNAANQELDHR
ncbi:hypothetical protein CAPTEDRAFT_202782, partial [Capitella teleta]